MNGDEEKGLKAAEELASSDKDNAVVQVLAGTVLQAAGKSEEALALLGLHQGSCKSTYQETTRVGSKNLQWKPLP